MVVLATKVYVRGDARERALRSLHSLLDDAVGDLDVERSVAVRDDGFPAVALAGPDAVAAEHALAEQWGAVTDEPVPGEEYVGTLEAWDDDGFVLDAGREVRVPAAELGLGPGTPAQVVERFGLVQHLPMRFVAGDTGSADGAEPVDDAEPADDAEAAAGAAGAADERDGPGGTADADAAGSADVAEGDSADPADAAGADPADAEPSPAVGPPRLSDAERDRLYGWRRGPGRVNVNSATRAEVRATVNRAGHARDVVTVERLGLLEQSIVCREDTDPPGLLAAIGDYLPAEMRCVVP